MTDEEIMHQCEIYDNYISALDDDPDVIEHYGTPRHSGRYPWGSGDNPFQRSRDFMANVTELKEKGMTDREIWESMGLSSTQFRAKKSLAANEIKKFNVMYAQKLKDKGMSNVAIAKRMETNESTVRGWLKDSGNIRKDELGTTMDMLEEQVKSKGMIDVGAGVEKHLGISKTRLDTAVAALEEKGYTRHKIQVANVSGNGTQKTTVTVLAPPDTEWKYVIQNKDKIHNIDDVASTDGGSTYTKLRAPEQISGKRVYIRYAEDGGVDKDGTLELRRGVKDLDMGSSSYAQVRVAVDGKYYMKGMAFYSDSIPDGYDIVYNTNKKRGTPDEKVYKPQSDDPINPFGVSIKPGGQRGALNIMNEEGDWDKWSRSLASQMLAKQPVDLAKKQLKLTKDIKDSQFQEIMELTNPIVKKHELKQFADACDKDAVELKAAAMPRQGTKVLLPFPNMKENQVYAPTLENGEEVVLIRYPHGGRFEIPRLIVNNKNQEAKKVMGNAVDAIGIHPKVAEQLSGADFDGDFVLCIPTKGHNIKTQKPLEKLKDFDPKLAYPGVTEKSPWKKGSLKEHIEMGMASNLITDMTLKGASDDEIARAVRHSMVIIDTGKHNLDYKRSYEENGIAALKKRYMGHIDPETGKYSTSVSTLLSRASGQAHVEKRDPTGRYEIDPETGEKIYAKGRLKYNKETGKSEYTLWNEPYVSKKTGKIITPSTKSTQMFEAKDARSLMSGGFGKGLHMEEVYADYANHMKALGNRARKEYISVKEPTLNKEARSKYSEEVDSLKKQLDTAKKNAPLERQAQLIASSMVESAKLANPDMTESEIKKLKGLKIKEAREAVGASKYRVKITDKEWEAIQAGAISKTTLEEILQNADEDRVKELAMPKAKAGMTPSKISLANTLLANGFTLAEVADRVGVSVSTLTNNSRVKVKAGDKA